MKLKYNMLNGKKKKKAIRKIRQESGILCVCVCMCVCIRATILNKIVIDAALNFGEKVINETGMLMELID